MFVEGPASFYALRLLLGAFEAGFFPGIILYHLLVSGGRACARHAYFMTAVALAGVIGGPVSGVLLTLDDVLGLRGWQWMFLLEGLPATVLGFLVWLVLPNGPADARWLTPDERDALLARLVHDRGTGAAGHHHRLGAALRTPRVWLLERGAPLPRRRDLGHQLLGPDTAGQFDLERPAGRPGLRAALSRGSHRDGCRRGAFGPHGRTNAGTWRCRFGSARAARPGEPDHVGRDVGGDAGVAAGGITARRVRPGPCRPRSSADPPPRAASRSSARSATSAASSARWVG